MTATVCDLCGKKIKDGPALVNGDYNFCTQCKYKIQNISSWGWKGGCFLFFILWCAFGYLMMFKLYSFLIIPVGVGVILLLYNLIFTSKTDAEIQKIHKICETWKGYPPDWNWRAYQIRTRDRHACRQCGAKKGELHIHHIIPVSKGGVHGFSNLVI